jgi:hypothetical protein
MYACEAGKNIELRDFICERCRYIIDNNVENIEKLKCKLCDEPKGIMIFVDKNTKKGDYIGWCHIACVFWHTEIHFADE